MDQSNLGEYQKLLDYNFKNPDLLTLALTHSSVARTRAESNERLEFLGDAVLGLVVCHQLYDEQGDLTEGQMTKIKSSVVSRQTCAEVAVKMGMGDMLFLGKGINKSGEVPLSVAAAVFESLIGAIYLDGQLAPAREFILRHIQPYIDEALANEHQSNFKSLLQQYAQRHWGKTPDYAVLDEKGPDHSKCFEIAVIIDRKTFRSAWGMSKKEAEQNAARLALEDLGLLQPDAPAEEQPL